MQGKRQFPRFRKNMIILCMTTILILIPSNIIPRLQGKEVLKQFPRLRNSMIIHSMT